MTGKWRSSSKHRKTQSISRLQRRCSLTAMDIKGFPITHHILQEIKTFLGFGRIIFVMFYEHRQCGAPRCLETSHSLTLWEINIHGGPSRGYVSGEMVKLERSELPLMLTESGNAYRRLPNVFSVSYVYGLINEVSSERTSEHYLQYHDLHAAIW